MNPVALITGASSGIGREIANLLTARGYRVFGTFRRDPPSGLAAGIALVRMDVTSGESVQRALNRVLEETGRIDALINNAGYGLFGALEETNIDEAREQFETNFFGAMRVTQGVLPVMRQQRSGRIVNMSSVLGLIPSPYAGIYAASKHALEGYTETLDHEVQRFGIRATLIEPSFARTGFLQNGKTISKPLADYAEDRAAVTHAFETQLNDGVAPQQIAETVFEALQSSSPRMRYAVGEAKTLSLLRRLVPASMFAKSLRKRFALTSNPNPDRVNQSC